MQNFQKLFSHSAMDVSSELYNCISPMLTQFKRDESKRYFSFLITLHADEGTLLTFIPFLHRKFFRRSRVIKKFALREISIKKSGVALTAMEGIDNFLRVPPPLAGYSQSLTFPGIKKSLLNLECSKSRKGGSMRNEPSLSHTR
jgi:hypothetical protein